MKREYFSCQMFRENQTDIFSLDKYCHMWQFDISENDTRWHFNSAWIKCNIVTLCYSDNLVTFQKIAVKIWTIRNFEIFLKYGESPISIEKTFRYLNILEARWRWCSRFHQQLAIEQPCAEDTSFYISLHIS